MRKQLDCRIKKDRMLRVQVFEKDFYTCQMCGIKPEAIPTNYNGRYTLAIEPLSFLVVDHIIPWKKGGATNISNLQTLCATCNSKKGNKYGAN